jgi:hypothetical protein
MIHHHIVSIVLRFLAGLVAGLLVIAGGGLWLLSRGPIEIDGVAPLIGAALSRGVTVTVTIDHTLLSLEGRQLLVLARGVHLQREGSANALSLASAALAFSPRAALRGIIAPTRIVFDQPDLQLERDADGSFHFGIGDLASDSAEDWGRQIIGDLVRAPNGESALGYLTTVTISRASLTVQDRALGVEWHATAADASLTRARDRTSGRFAITAGQGAGQTRLDGDFIFLPAFNRLVTRVGFGGLRPAAWADAAPSLAGLAGIDLPISGEVRAEFDPARFTLRDAIVDLTLGKGALHNALFPDGALPLAGAKLQGGYDAVKGQINLGLLSLDLDPGTLTAAGTVEGLGTDLLSGAKPQGFDLKLNLGAQGLRLADFPRFWPEKANVSTRRWVTQHIQEGTVDTLDARLALRVDLSPDAAKPAVLDELDGTMKFTGLTVEYFRPLAPVKGVTGTAHFDRTMIEFDATTGDLGNIHATGAIARFYQLDTHDEQAKITVAAQGPLADALAVLDTPPLYYAREIRLDPKRAGGTFQAQLRFDFPLIDRLELSDIAYGADATINDVVLGAVMFGRDLTQGALKLKLDPDKAQVDGMAQLGGVPLILSWTQSLQDNPKVRTHYAVKATLDEAARQMLGFDVPDAQLGGNIGVDASYDLGTDKRARLLATLDLKDASVTIKKLAWSKAPGAAATARLALDLADDKVRSARDVTLIGSGIDMKIAASFDETGAFSSVDIDHFIAGIHDNFRGRLARDARGGWQVSVSGSSFDASGLIDDLDQAPSAAPEPPLAIEADIDRVRLGEDRTASAVVLKLVSDGTHWQEASADARLSGTSAVQLRYSGAGERPFALTSDNLGALLKLLGIYDDIIGGKLNLNGQAIDRDGQRVLVTKATGGDYRVVKAPTLARLLSLASISGINALLTGQGIPFTRLEGNVEFTTGEITLSNARTYGGAIGINASGIIDRNAKQLNISGTLVPAYTLNSVIGDIPLIGNLLVGGQGQGVFASNFRLYGPTDEPQVSVNALSTLAPGFLRNLFLFSPRGP